MGRLRVCIISKYPPVQGGMASAAYWLARGLGRAGVDVHVVTDGNLVEPEYRISDPGAEELAGVTVHYVPSDLPWHIPHTEHRLAKLVDRALAVCKDCGAELIDAQYLVPYGFAGSVVSAFSGVPYIIRHGGSDLAKFLSDGHFRLLMERTFGCAAVTVSDDPRVTAFAAATAQLPRYVPDGRQFVPGRKALGSIRCAYVGKINYYWRHKGLHKVARTVSGSGIDMVYLAQGKGMGDFLKKCEPEGVFREFVHPSRMPDFLQQVDFLFCLQGENPLVDFSNLVLEAVSVGIPILTDRADLFKVYEDCFDVSRWVIQMDSSLKGVAFAKWLQRLEKPEPTPLKMKYDAYIQENIALYEAVVRPGGR